MTLKKRFGTLIRELRIKKELGQRELAKKIGIAPSYLNDIEKEKRTAERTKRNAFKTLCLVMFLKRKQEMLSKHFVSKCF